jgi:hypothetical protein
MKQSSSYFTQNENRSTPILLMDGILPFDNKSNWGGQIQITHVSKNVFRSKSKVVSVLVMNKFNKPGKLETLDRIGL